MYRSLFEKEWIKIKWVLLAYFLISFAVIVSIASDLRFEFQNHGAINNWLNTVLYHIFYFNLLKYLPVIAGFALAVLQFLPESLDKRYRLSFHLPINEKKLLLFNLMIGMIAILIIDIIVLLGFVIMSSSFYPYEIVFLSAISTIPWFMAGLIIYLGVSTVISEPNWFQKIVLSVMTFYSINLLLQEKSFGQYNQVLVYYTILIMLYTIMILFPGHRLRKGAK